MERHIANLNPHLREPVWAAVTMRLRAIPIDTHMMVRTLDGQQMGARVCCSRQHHGKPNYQPMLTFLAGD